MHSEQDAGPQPPPMPQAARARPLPRKGGGLSLGRLLLAAGVLLLLAWYIGNRKPAAPEAEVATPAIDAPAPTPMAAQSEALVVRGEKSTTLRNVDEARMSVQAQGEVLRIEGSVGRNFARELQAALEAHPALRRIDITSGGGYAGPGLEAARMIRRRNLTVRVQSHCASMCVALWAAAAQRQMEPEALIGLHQWNAQCDARPSPEREECHYQVQFATDHDSSYRAWLREAGFNQRLLDLQSSTAPEDIAVLSAPQLWENGVDFSVVDPQGKRMSRAEVQRHLADRSQRR